MFPVHERRWTLYLPIGLFIPLLIVASYVQWKKVSRGRKINLVMAFTTAFFGLSTIAVSNLCDGAIHQSLSLIDIGYSTGSLVYTR